MVLNFKQIKDLPPLRILFCKKNTGPTESSLISKAMTGISQLRKKQMKNREPVISIKRFMMKYDLLLSIYKRGEIYRLTALSSAIKEFDKLSLVGINEFLK